MSLADGELDSLITDITVDCYDDGEALTGFECAFDEEVRFPIGGVVIGEEVSVRSVAQANGRRELIATCVHGGRTFAVAMLDVEIHDPAAARLVAAYRRWLGP